MLYFTASVKRRSWRDPSTRLVARDDRSRHTNCRRDFSGRGPAVRNDTQRSYVCFAEERESAEGNAGLKLLRISERADTKKKPQVSRRTKHPSQTPLRASRRDDPSYKCSTFDHRDRLGPRGRRGRRRHRGGLRPRERSEPSQSGPGHRPLARSLPKADR